MKKWIFIILLLWIALALCAAPRSGKGTPQGHVTHSTALN